MTGAPIVPVAVGAAPCSVLRSWDRFVVPHPFARAVVLFGAPHHGARGRRPRARREPGARSSRPRSRSSAGRRTAGPAGTMYRLYSLVLGAPGARLPAAVPRAQGLGRRVPGGASRAPGLRAGPAAGPCPAGRFWVHAVSVGEVMAAVPLVQALRARWPAARRRRVDGDGHRRASGAIAARGAAAMLTFPLDFPGAVRRAVRPGGARLLHRARDGALAQPPAGAPPGRRAGRARQRPHLRPLLPPLPPRPRLFRRVLDDVALFCMQSEEDARRIISLGRPPRAGAGHREPEDGGRRPGTPAPSASGAGSSISARPRSSSRAARIAARRPSCSTRSRRCARRPTASGSCWRPRHPERLDEVEGLVRARDWRRSGEAG